VANTQWLDRSQPQTLYLANVLLYIDAAIWVLQLLAFGTLGFGGLFALLAVGAIFAGVGVANEKKVGYWGAVVVAALNILLLLKIGASSISVLLSLLFGIALLALLLHPVSRNYQRIWFKRLAKRRR
jgi:hypothetical protein